MKICCIGSSEEAWTAISAGASALGLVAPMPSGPGTLPLEKIAPIVRSVPPPITTFLLTPLRTATEIRAQHAVARTHTIQLCDRVETAEYARLRAELPGIKLVQVIHVLGEESVVEARAVAGHVDALLLDSGNPALAVKELGGTGRTHDWELSRRIREEAGIPVFLAGGLRSENVAEAIERVRPFAVDVCSGVRTEGVLDDAKLREFMRAVEGVALET